MTWDYSNPIAVQDVSCLRCFMVQNNSTFEKSKEKNTITAYACQNCLHLEFHEAVTTFVSDTFLTSTKTLVGL